MGAVMSTPDLQNLLRSHQGHFVLESGHHGNLWLDLERLCLRVGPIKELTNALAERLAKEQIEVVCGPLVEGAFVALLVAESIGVPFTYSEREAATQPDGLYPFHYRIPDPLRAEVHGRRVAIVNDVINAGSAVRGTFIDLQSCGADIVALGTLAALGEWAGHFAAAERLSLIALDTFANTVWEPSECPLCAKGEPLVDLAKARGQR
jgi:orotate phosphoribosyltransferase